MNIFADFNSMLELEQFGIGIPLTDDRALKVADSLKNVSIKGPKEVSWPELCLEDLLLVHSEAYSKKLLGTKEEKEEILTKAFELINEKGEYNRYHPDNSKYELYELADRILRQSAGTYLASEDALRSGFSYFLGGGFHHAHHDFSHGFCLVNDILVAIRKLQREEKIQNAWIIDVDAHKGDGTAAITINDDSIKTLSIHMAHGWPLDMQEDANAPWFCPSNIDIGINPGEEESYLEKLETGLQKLAGLSKESPDIALVVQGSDPYEEDILPSADHLKMTAQQMFERDKMVYQFLKSRNIAQAYVMSGGYGPHVAKIYQQFLKWVLEDRK